MLDLAGSRRPPALDSCGIARALAPASRWLLRGGRDALAAAARALGLEEIDRPCRACSNGTRAALWLGPDERLLLAAEGESDALREPLERSLAGTPHSLVEISHGWTALEVFGPEAASALNAGCPLDLERAAFPVGMCTRTVFAKAQIVLWRTEAETFRLETARSLAAYVSRLLALAASETQDFGRSLAGS
jgi:sarcosine oxidase subunit gamma